MLLLVGAGPTQSDIVCRARKPTRLHVMRPIRWLWQWKRSRVGPGVEPHASALLAIARASPGQDDWQAEAAYCRRAIFDDKPTTILLPLNRPAQVRESAGPR